MRVEFNRKDMVQHESAQERRLMVTDMSTYFCLCTSVLSYSRFNRVLFVFLFLGFTAIVSIKFTQHIERRIGAKQINDDYVIVRREFIVLCEMFSTSGIM